MRISDRRTPPVTPPPNEVEGLIHGYIEHPDEAFRAWINTEVEGFSGRDIIEREYRKILDTDYVKPGLMIVDPEELIKNLNTKLIIMYPQFHEIMERFPKVSKQQRNFTSFLLFFRIETSTYIRQLCFNPGFDATVRRIKNDVEKRMKQK